MAEIWRIALLIGTVAFALAAAATVALLIRAEWSPNAGGRRRPHGARSRMQLWPDPACIPHAGRRYYWNAVRSAWAAAAALAFALVALAHQ